MGLRSRVERLERKGAGRAVILVLEDPYAEEVIPASPDLVEAAFARQREIHGSRVKIIRFVNVEVPPVQHDGGYAPSHE